MCNMITNKQINLVIIILRTLKIKRLNLLKERLVHYEMTRKTDMTILTLKLCTYIRDHNQGVPL